MSKEGVVLGRGVTVNGSGNTLRAANRRLRATTNTRKLALVNVNRNVILFGLIRVNFCRVLLIISRRVGTFTTVLSRIFSGRLQSKSITCESRELKRGLNVQMRAHSRAANRRRRKGVGQFTSQGHLFVIPRNCQRRISLNVRRQRHLSTPTTRRLNNFTTLLRQRVGQLVVHHLKCQHLRETTKRGPTAGVTIERYHRRRLVPRRGRSASANFVRCFRYLSCNTTFHRRRLVVIRHHLSPSTGVPMSTEPRAPRPHPSDP